MKIVWKGSTVLVDVHYKQAKIKKKKKGGAGVFYDVPAP